MEKYKKNIKINLRKKEIILKMINDRVFYDFLYLFGFIVCNYIFGFCLV